MTSRERSVRLPLNISESRETGTGRFLSTYAGAGVQHIAMATEDIVHTLTILMARGARILPIPANYYDDLEAKWDLGDARIVSCARSICCMIATKRGEFLHAYTETFEDRFFFEIVQRIGEYQQYGAVNAAVRMAAQAQRHLSLRLSGLLT